MLQRLCPSFRAENLIFTPGEAVYRVTLRFECFERFTSIMDVEEVQKKGCVRITNSFSIGRCASVSRKPLPSELAPVRTI